MSSSILLIIDIRAMSAIHNLKWVKIIQIWQNGGQKISNLADWCHFLSLTGLKADMYCANIKCKKQILTAPAVKGLTEINKDWNSYCHWHNM